VSQEPVNLCRCSTPQQSTSICQDSFKAAQLPRRPFSFLRGVLPYFMYFTPNKFLLILDTVTIYRTQFKFKANKFSFLTSFQLFFLHTISGILNFLLFNGGAEDEDATVGLGGRSTDNDSTSA
jgi:hypothetical protein